MEAPPAEEEGISIQANYERLKTAINSITLNACKYSDNKPANLCLRPEKANEIIVVQDEGVGIPGDELKYIYDPAD